MTHRTSLLLNIFLFAAFAGRCEDLPAARVNFNFNNYKIQDPASQLIPKLVNVSFTEDRFGNSASAIRIHGNEDSYVNLGTDRRLKNSQGSISLWVQMEEVRHFGSGIYANPVIVTKNCACNDFNEAYSIYYSIKRGVFQSLFSQDSLKQVATSTQQKIELGKWYHLVLVYDSSSSALFVNGVLEGRFRKDFPVTFDPRDSVLVGVTGNKKNNRVFQGVVDDISFYDRVLTHREIEGLYHAPNPNENAVVFKKLLNVIYLLAGCLVVILLLRFRHSRKLKREKMKLEMTNQLLSNELRINRAQMNPHFVFNALNTLHNYILSSNIDKASDYLTRLSKLIRKILESNMSDTIVLDQEIDLLELYLEIESMRFMEPLHHEVVVGKGVVPSAITLPIMMIQPFIENAIWHGLREKSGVRTLSVRFEKPDDRYLECVIEDNGIGRSNTSQKQSGRKSLATGFVRQRLELLNRLYNVNCSLDIYDKPDEQGTLVRLTLPIINKLDLNESEVYHN